RVGAEHRGDAFVLCHGPRSACDAAFPHPRPRGRAPGAAPGRRQRFLHARFQRAQVLWLDGRGATFLVQRRAYHAPGNPFTRGPNREVIARSRLRFIRSSSASLPPQVMAKLEETFSAPVIEAYAMTEAAH